MNATLRYTVLSCALLALAGGAQKASSAGLGLEIAPAKLDISIPAGVTHNIPISVHNSSTNSVHVVASMVDFAVGPTGEYEYTKPGSRQYSLMRWAAINPREFDLPPETTQQVRLSLVVPSDTSLTGEYAGIVFFQTRPDRRGGAVAFSARVASKIYDTFPGTVKIGGAIAKVETISGPSNQLYKVAFRNTGNTHVYLNGRVEVRQGSDVVEKLALPAQLLVERNGERHIEVSGKKLAPGSYAAVAIIDYGGPRLTGGEVRFEVK